MLTVFEPTQDPAWRLDVIGYDPSRESDVEARFTVGNGLLGVRAARSVGRSPLWLSWTHSVSATSWPRTYVAGLFDTPDIEPPVPVLMPAADWLRVNIHLNDMPVQLRTTNLVRQRRSLDLRRGALIEEILSTTDAGLVVRISTLRIASQSQRPIGLQLVRLQIESPDVAVRLEANFDQALMGLDLEQLTQNLGVWATWQSGKRLAMAGAAGLAIANADIAPSYQDNLQWVWRCTAGADQDIFLWRLAAVVRSDSRQDDPAPAALAALAVAQGRGWQDILAAHEAAWGDRWDAADIRIDGDPIAQQALRFAIYHLISAANPLDDHVSIGARGLTGDSYLGHVFWDTEIYALPFYVAAWPDAARSLLMYRYRTIAGARAKAAALGYRGAMYPWESADSGLETTPNFINGADGKPIAVLTGKQEQHITACVAYAVWHYWRQSGDDGFLHAAGAEILLETARFWASRITLEADGHGHIRGVIGPDEYHETIDDNAFTNQLARWNILRGVEIAGLLRETWPLHWEPLAMRLGLNDAELSAWQNAADRLVTGLDPVTGLIEQFAGFYGLEDIDLAPYAQRQVPIDVVLGRSRVQQSKISKQADVVALLGLLPEDFSPAIQATNFAYYEPHCGHGSSLSRVMHALVAARLGNPELALRFFHQSAAIDLSDGAGGSAGGVHIATLGGLWQVVVLGFAGIATSGGALIVKPHLPASWQSLDFQLRWQRRCVRVQVTQAGAVVTLVDGETMEVELGGARHELRLGAPVTG
jgi:trehalose/maltose hydrolase-like predicted phosphorylase